jgi:RNA polymerase sigma factor (sigma-70 family)
MGEAFPGTRLSVLRAAHSADEATRQQAWDAIVEAYWKPSYKYLRLRWRAAPEEAEDLTQGFFTRALEKSFFSGYDPARARFRTFLRTCLDGHVANERRAAGRGKRGAGRSPVDLAEIEEEIAHAVPPVDPDELFQQEFVRRVMELAIARLYARCAGTARELAFAVFRRRDVEGAEQPPSYAELAQEFGLPVTQVTNHLSAMRRELRVEILAALRALTATESEYEAEVRAIFGRAG